MKLFQLLSVVITLTYNIDEYECNNPISLFAYRDSFLLDWQVANFTHVTGRTHAEKSLTIVKVNTSTSVVTRIANAFVIISATTLFG